MKKKKNKLISFLAWILLLSVRGEAQTPFAYQESLDTVHQAAFYKITLTPGLVAKCRQDMGDLRVSDQNNQYIPYVLKSDLPVLSTDAFREFGILSNEKLKDSSTEVVIKNGSAASLNYLLLVMKNSSAYRTATLSGSDDRRKWYAIREHIELQEAGSDTADHFVQSISFPSSSYHYFKIILDDKGLLPLHILKAGIYARSFAIGRYQDVPDPAIRQKDSNDKHSYIELFYKEAYRIDKLDLGIKGPALYKRDLRIYDNDVAGMPLAMKAVLDPLNTSFRIPAVKSSRLLIEISNEDNTPLVIQRAATSQLDQYLLAYLQPGIHYRIVAGNVLAKAPQYDLKYFVDSLTRDVQEVGTGALQTIAGDNGPAFAGKDHSAVLLWSIIGGMLVLLVFLSVKMLTAVTKNDAPDRL
jgi:hypothetical protein